MITIEYLRSFKLGEYAIFDLVASFVGIYLLAPALTYLFKFIKLDIPRSSWLYLTLPMSILVHMLVGKYTPMTKYFLDPSGHYLLKLFIIGLLVFGLKAIRLIK